MIKFITEKAKKDKSPTFGQVEENQFFIDAKNRLCQKMNAEAYIVLTNEQGDPWATWLEDIEEDRIINKILPKVIRIEWE